MLDEARSFRYTIDELKLDECGLDAQRWLCLVGVDFDTRVVLPIHRDHTTPGFDLRSRDRMNDRNDTDEKRRVRTGDGTVPFQAAIPTFLPLERIVCLRPWDFGYWELRDRLLRNVAGFHGTLQTMNLVQRLAAAFLLNEPKRKGLGAWRPPGAAHAAWDPPIAKLKDTSE